MTVEPEKQVVDAQAVHDRVYLFECCPYDVAAIDRAVITWSLDVDGLPPSVPDPCGVRFCLLVAVENGLCHENWRCRGGQDDLLTLNAEGIH